MKWDYFSILRIPSFGFALATSPPDANAFDYRYIPMTATSLNAIKDILHKFGLILKLWV